LGISWEKCYQLETLGKVTAQGNGGTGSPLLPLGNLLLPGAKADA